MQAVKGFLSEHAIGKPGFRAQYGCDLPEFGGLSVGHAAPPYCQVREAQGSVVQARIFIPLGAPTLRFNEYHLAPFCETSHKRRYAVQQKGTSARQHLSRKFPCKPP